LQPEHSCYQDCHKAPILTNAQYQKTLSHQVSATKLISSTVAAGESSVSQLQGGKVKDSQRTSSRKWGSSSAKQSSGHVRKAKRLPLRLAPFAAPRLQTIPVPLTWTMSHCFFSNVSAAAPGLDVSQTCRTLYQLAALHAQNALHRLTDAARTEKDRQTETQTDSLQAPRSRCRRRYRHIQRRLHQIMPGAPLPAAYLGRQNSTSVSSVDGPAYNRRGGGGALTWIRRANLCSTCLSAFAPTSRLALVAFRFDEPEESLPTYRFFDGH
ncbi:hypothetical protein CABS01_15883, partial [Colletotrichum abscissum]|uniref:uncharacterized protein n=1 Tax=Colletotrichum abscissum TaxID=1671311 RepID=UPI0027D5ED38